MRILLFIALMFVTPAFAAFTNNEDVSDLEIWKHQIEDNRAAEAEPALQKALAEDPNNADILNLLGYAHRKLGRLDTSRAYYIRALEIKPTHFGALEYMGELELEIGNIEAAKALLVRLRAACPSGCEELTDLEEAFKERGVPTS